METGKIIDIVGTTATVQFNNPDACNSCGAKVLCKAGDDGTRTIRAEAPTSAAKGDSVAVEESESFLIKLSLLQYGVPLLGFVLGAGVSWAYPVSLFTLPADVTHLLAAVAGMFLGGVFSYLWAVKIAQKKDTGFRIIHVEPMKHG